MRHRWLDISSSACRFLTRHSSSSSKAPTTPALPDFEPRTTFALPSTVPSWYAGHMYRAMRSLPALLARDPPPLIIEARDARLPITSINPAFERVMQDTFGSSSSGKGKAKGNDWESRRLVVYTHRDLIDPAIEKPLVRAFEEHGRGQQVMFVDTRSDNDVRRVIRWINKQAKALVDNPPPPARMTRELARTLHRLSGAFKHTPTPEDGVRLVIVGMPNVGKSSLLNALRRVGAGKGKAASTAPTPGHTRKLTGTVRITKDVVKDPTTASPRGGEAAFQLDRDSPSPSSSSPPVYVYDTPGVMVPFLGRGRQGAEKGVKLAVAAGIKSSLFDTQGLADYLLYRLNLRYDWEKKRWHAWKGDAASSVEPPMPEYLAKLPMPSGEAQLGPTNDIEELLGWAAMRAPGSLLKGGERDLEGTAEFILQRWREGKLGDCELDLGLKETQAGATEPAATTLAAGEAEEDYGLAAQIDRVVRQHFKEVEEAQRAGADRQAWKRPPSEYEDEGGYADFGEAEDAEDMAPLRPPREARRSEGSSPRASHSRRRSDDNDTSTHSLVSANQTRLRKKIADERERRERLRARGVLKDDRDPLKRAREKHKQWLIRMGKLKVHGARSGRAARAGAR